MSDSNRIQLAYALESTPYTAATGPYALLNISSCDMGQQKNTVQENTIRADRNLKGLIQTSMIPQGGFGFDFIYGNLDGLLTGLMGNSFSTPVSLSGVAVTIASNVITADSGTPFSVAAVGQWLKIVISAVVYVVKVTVISGAGAAITVVGATLPNGAATLTTVKGKYVRNGTTMQTYTFEKNFSDQATKGFFAFLGMVPNTASLNCQAETIVTGDMKFLGTTASVPTDTSVSAMAYSAAVTNESFAGLAGNIGTFMVGGSLILPSSMAIKGLNLSINNNVRRDAAINVTTMGWGEFDVTGTLSTFFKGGMSAVDDFFTHANTSASYAMTDPAGNVAVISILRMKLATFTNQVGGKNQAVMGDLGFTGILDPTTGATLQIDLLPA